jgi:hypothetical protein
MDVRKSVAGYDATSIAQAGEFIGTAVAKGGAAIGEAMGQSGAALGRGVSDLGKGITDVAKGVDQYRHNVNEWELASAQADKQTQLAQAETELENDKDYGTMQDRYSQRLQQINQDAVSKISDPQTQQRFQMWSAPRDAYWTGKVTGYAKKVEGDQRLADTATKLDQLKDSGLKNPDPIARTDAIETGNQLITSLEQGGFISAVKSQQWRKSWAVDYAKSSFEIMPPEERMKALDDTQNPHSLTHFLPEDDRVSMRERAKNQYIYNRQQTDSEGALNRYNTRNMATDDIAAITATGQGGDENVIRGRLERDYGPKSVAEWQNARLDASSIYQGTSDMYSLPDDQITARLDEYRPKPGADNFERRQTIFNAVQKKADEVRKQRASDPAASVSDDPAVKKATLVLDPKDEKTFAPLVDARLAAQERAGIPPEARSPITHQEALTLTAPLARVLPGQEKAVLTDLAQSFKDKFGPNADTAFQYALRARHVDNETALQGGRMMRRMGLGGQPDKPGAQATDRAAEVDSADRAVTGTFDDIGSGLPIPAPSEKPLRQPLPPSADVKALLANPRLSDRFDEKWGKGSARKLLDTYTKR